MPYIRRHLLDRGNQVDARIREIARQPCIRETVLQKTHHQRRPSSRRTHSRDRAPAMHSRDRAPAMHSRDRRAYPVLGASNLPGAIDTAFLRRLSLKLRVRCPDAIERSRLLHELVTNKTYSSVRPEDLRIIDQCTATEQLTGADIKSAMTVACNAAKTGLRSTDKWAKVSAQF